MNKASFEINFPHFKDSHDNTMAYWIMSEPEVIFPYLNFAATMVSKKLNS